MKNQQKTETPQNKRIPRFSSKTQTKTKKMKNKPNFKSVILNTTTCMRNTYNDFLPKFTKLESQFKANSNPIKANQSQFNAIFQKLEYYRKYLYKKCLHPLSPKPTNPQSQLKPIPLTPGPYTLAPNTRKSLTKTNPIQTQSKPNFPEKTYSKRTSQIFTKNRFSTRH
jgi:hypothetical protein